MGAIMDVVIYRAIFGDYDNKPLRVSGNFGKHIRFLLFTDKDVEVDGWDVIVTKATDPVLGNRHCKMFPWEYFDSDCSLYLDGHIELGDMFDTFFQQILSAGYIFAAMRHRAAGNIYDELVRNIDNSKLSRSQLSTVLNANLKFDRPSIECGLIFRNHHDKVVRSHAEKWWWYFNNICPRDQLSVQTAANDVDLKLDVIDCDFSNRSYFKAFRHKNWFFRLLNIRLRLAIRIFLKGYLLRP